MAERCGGKQSTHRIERLRVDRPSPGRLRLVATWILLGAPGTQPFEPLGVELEDALHRGRVGLAEAFVPVVAEAAAGEPAVVGDVAGRLLEVGREPAALEDLREDVRGPLAGEVRATELGDRIVSEL